MPEEKTVTLSSEYVSVHKYFTATKNAYQLPGGKIVDPYFVVQLPDSACVLGLTKQGECVLVKQYRYPANEVMLEPPGGFIEEGEDPAAAVLREMEEETGYVFGKAISLGVTYANPGVLNNKTFLFLALDGELLKEPALDDNEEIEVILMSLENVKQILKNDGILQSMHALCVYKALEKLKELGQ